MGTSPSVEAILAGAQAAVDKGNKDFPSNTGKPAPGTASGSHQYSKAPYAMATAAKKAAGVGDMTESMKEASETGRSIKSNMENAAKAMQ